MERELAHGAAHAQFLRDLRPDLVVLQEVNPNSAEALWERTELQWKRDLNYNATRFIQMVSEHGGVEAARQLLRAPKVSDGFTTLWEKKRLDLSQYR